MVFGNLMAPFSFQYQNNLELDFCSILKPCEISAKRRKFVSLWLKLTVHLKHNAGLPFAKKSKRYNGGIVFHL